MGEIATVHDGKIRVAGVRVLDCRRDSMHRGKGAAYRVSKTHRTHVCVWLASIQALTVAKGLGLCF